ncbi:AAA family ATPase [Halomonas profundus]|uniref:Prokaryotic chromosome segregation/condensation protein MukB n=1 Tax=Vreelandella titanicae BH1 TaxID=1204738 RepID=L9UBI1_9GAMM|nr:AAA family ATPase [Halomonas titanicae]ELY21981.1 Prokaryotic chromosome segregation/condensation protein MukB [Halomonas titanicae BH1]NVE90195.1 AAA family ATPase [Halomonas titanicae]UEQ04999.1 AAA family ATPase [Halomonas profundus]|tara:strand:- start:613 stop:2952 length:2340 start_codon:yes stop_codon:yes gene_type:complete
MNWQISKIEISSFKAFKQIHLDFSDSSLLTLDGPNGFGKTSVFDAIELLLTGSIKRIRQLFTTLMMGNKTNYKDNLLWNKRSGKKDLAIKIEFFNGTRKIVLARHTPAADFEEKANNRADQFNHLNLFELPIFSSNDYIAENLRDESFIEELFGKNFKENFSYLNYLEQGQNQLLHTRVDKRKEALNNLFNIRDVKAETDKCRAISMRLTKFINDPKRAADLLRLEIEADSLKGMIQADPGAIEYKKISTAVLHPGWDKESPFPTYAVEIHAEYVENLQRLGRLVTLKRAIQIRDKNEEIEKYIELNKDSVKSLARFGSDMDKLEDLDVTKNKLNELIKSIEIIKRGATVIKAYEAESLPGWGQGRLNWFLEQIVTRDALQKKSNSNANAATELNLLKVALLAEHAKLYADDKHCPLCGADWQAHDNMLQKIELRTKQINDALSADGQNLINLTGIMSAELATIEAQIQARHTQLSVGYNNALHNALLRDKSRLPAITKLAARLQALGVQLDYSFSENEEEVAPRTQELTASIRSQKAAETEPLPEDWRKVITAAFNELQDFYIVEPQALKDKELYIEAKANEAQSSRLKQCFDEIQDIKREKEAARIAKDKVNKLKTTLEKTERNYSEQTIAEIELIFHIYSGRLIQNYQRGLGLFIESKDGKELRFLTAEKSEYDAILSMSSGQVSALSLGFFLSLNKVYSSVPLILIDDPSQSLDEVNIASLTDLLRCEFSHRQLIVSSHEDDISAYMRYRFTKAGLSTQSLNMQRLAKEALVAAG